jgi:hypothetical protein
MCLSPCLSRGTFTFFVSHCLASMSPVIGEMEPHDFFTLKQQTAVLAVLGSINNEIHHDAEDSYGTYLDVI